jgi:hypothetical protein
VADEEGQRSAHAIYARLTPDGVEFAAVTPEYLARLEAVAAAADKATSEILHMDPYPFLGRDGPDGFSDLAYALDKLDHYKRGLPD